MIQITLAQLREASYAANEVNRLEAAKDSAAKHIFRHDLEVPKSSSDPLGYVHLDIEVPAALIREQLAARIAAAHKVLRDCGIELVG